MAKKTILSGTKENEMKFNWIVGNTADEQLQRFCIDLEYQLRPRIVKFLIEKFDHDCCSDFSCFHFDVDLQRNLITLANSTPEQYRREIESDFNKCIGTDCC